MRLILADQVFTLLVTVLVVVRLVDLGFVVVVGVVRPGGGLEVPVKTAVGRPYKRATSQAVIANCHICTNVE